MSIRPPRPRQPYRRPSPELDAITTAAMTAIGQHIQYGPGYGMAVLTDLRWRLGEALQSLCDKRMTYRGALTRTLAKRLTAALGQGYGETTIFVARRLVRRYSRRADIPRFVAWSTLRPFLYEEPPLGEPEQAPVLRRPGLIELRRLVRRAVQLWAGKRWLELPCEHPSALLYRVGGVTVLVRIIHPKLRYLPLPLIDDQAKTVIEVRWGEQLAISCRRKHPKHSRIDLKELRGILLGP